MVIINPVSFIEKETLRFLIMDAPSNEHVEEYVQAMLHHGVSHLVRTCELTYSEKPFTDAGITCHAMPFADGEAPPETILVQWLNLVSRVSRRGECIAVHCVAGLGRAPVLVAIALIEKCNIDNLDAIEYIRTRRKGAINRKQLQYLRAYRRRSKKKESCCSMM
eukprot:Gregarina_sp_Poly_1__18@NODE_1003_length_5403_cov_517_252249_g371_i1_p4_GENE_NODE_1003_length_5403_cov_517_252249_g371_i1NODE_1003_length_5403_cov_517_252249_g371_i1_p4_ORF_typecomplete_len164_score16_27DSPc/PF00782_20/4_9e16CDKN3/PF05706_12/1_6e11Y_phosphatase/PF00102_27/49Y_phosphatase/PF00102_27/3_5e08PTPlike_phytase/PF14566_6/9_7e07DUF1972/PF09314_11/0_087Y_phosphatase3/PF13350_6/0_17DUF2828/PF11443_8/0_22_NODE_1003_length_5403_cov_517_252249_g371_i128923383